jgi:UDPglucose 6-dehydrogenase
MKIGIVGYGYVGKAVAASYEPNEVLISDPAYADISCSLLQLREQCNAIFVCVPTPQSKDGACDTTILESVVDQLTGYTGVVIAKSTASPLVYQQLEESSGLKLAHVPEFLTQANAIDDYLNPNKIVVGCRRNIIEEVTEVLLQSKVQFFVNIEYCAIGEAAFFKYMANTFLAMKVIMNNEYYDLANKIGLDWAVLKDIATTDTRLGNSHWQVPGPDGARGFGGACFPKDTQALAKIAMDLGVKMLVLDTALVRNHYYRDQESS